MQSAEVNLKDRSFWRDARMEKSGFWGGLTNRFAGDIKNLDNRRSFLKLPMLENKTGMFLSQVHGTKIFRATLKKSNEVPAGLEGDGWVCDEPGVIPCVLVADSLPVFIWDLNGKSFGVFHAGWKGLAAGFARIAASEMAKNFNLEARDLMASVGPHIGACCYRVGPEFQNFFSEASFQKKKDTLCLDMGFEAKSQLSQAGLQENNILISPDCTFCSGNYFSYRAGQAGRMAAFMTFAHHKEQ